MTRHQKSLLDFFTKKKGTETLYAPAASSPSLADVKETEKDGLSLSLEVSTTTSSSTISFAKTPPSADCSCIVGVDVTLPHALQHEDELQEIVTRYSDKIVSTGGSTGIINNKSNDDVLGCTSLSFHRTHKSRCVRRKSGVKRKRKTVQTSLDFGQNNAGGVKTCALCWMMFNPNVEEDVRLHERHCVSLSCGKRERKQAGDADAWLISEKLVKALDNMAEDQHRRCGAGTESSREGNNERFFCRRVQDPSHDDFSCYVFDCSKRGFAVDSITPSLVEALRFTDVRLSAVSYILVVVVHRRAARVVCAVAGRSSTREQDPALVLLQQDGAKTYCSTRSCMTFCDVAYVWWQCETVLSSLGAHWWSTETEVALKSTREAVRDFFRPTSHCEDEQQKRLSTLVNAALLCALNTLGRHVTYGYALCPRTQFSYDKRNLRDRVLNRVDAVTMCSDARPIYTHRDGCADNGASGSDDELSVVSYGD